MSKEVTEVLFPKYVYHATILEHFDSIKDRILIDREDANIYLDFGKGFYTTTIFDQANERAYSLQEQRRDPKSRALSKKDRGIIIQFELDPEILYNVEQDKFKVFPEIDLVWAEFIVNCRVQQRPPFHHQYTWTYGGMADGNTVYLCKQYYQNKINADQLLNGYFDEERQDFIRGIKPFKENYDQLVFHNDWVNEGVLSNPRLMFVKEDIIQKRG